MSTRVRWGVIGCGGIARRRTIPEGLAPAENAELVAVFNPTVEVSEAVARQFGARAVESVNGLLARDNLDAIYVASPPAVHREQTLACAARASTFCAKNRSA